MLSIGSCNLPKRRVSQTERGIIDITKKYTKSPAIVVYFFFVNSLYFDHTNKNPLLHFLLKTFFSFPLFTLFLDKITPFSSPLFCYT